MITIGTIVIFLLVMTVVGAGLYFFEKLDIDPSIKRITKFVVIGLVVVCLLLWLLAMFGVNMQTPIVPSGR